MSVERETTVPTVRKRIETEVNLEVKLKLRHVFLHDREQHEDIHRDMLQVPNY